MTLLKTLSINFLLLGMALAAALSERKAEVVPFTPLGAVAAIQDQTGDTRIYYQKADGSIWQWCEKGTFTAGVPSTCNAMIIPANEVLPGTPLAVTPIVTPSYGAYAPGFSLYYFSPSNVVSEFSWDPTRGSRHGPSCADCLTTSGFTAQAGSNVLYVLQLQSTDAVRVGFVSAGAPGTLSEVENSTNGKWKLATLPA